MELITVKYDNEGNISEILELDCATCGGPHHAEDCPNAFD